MQLDKLNVGLAITGSFCTLNSFIPEIKKLKEEGANITAIFSDIVATLDNKFSTAAQRHETILEITGNEPITSIVGAEPIGPKKLFDILIVAPCTGNTLAKIANSISDTPVTMGVKSHLRGNRPVIIGISTNDALGGNGKNLGALLNTKNIYFVPFFQDSPIEKEKSLCFEQTLLVDTIKCALAGRQIQPLVLGAKAK